MVGLEPACISTICDELTGLFLADERAHYLAAHTLFLSEPIDRHGREVPLLWISRSALV